MDKSKALMSAALVAASFGSLDIAAAEVKNSCVPIYRGRTVSINAICDATKLNKELKLKLNRDGCAYKQTKKNDPMTHYFEQASFYEYLEEGETSQLRDCELEDIAAMESEL